MRALGIAFLLVTAQIVPALAAAQTVRREGNYRLADGKTVPWRIDDHHSLVWNGARYTPVGLRVDGNVAAVNVANEAGLKDLLIDLPVSGPEWDPTIATAEANGQRYLLRLSSLAPGAAGIAVDPAAYRIAGLTGPKHIDIALPGASEALVVVAQRRDSTILTASTIAVKDGHLVTDTKVNKALETVVLIYPRMERLEMPDLWEELDGHRDLLLAKLRRTRFGPGLRGIVDPLGRSMTLPGREIHGVPSSPAFQAELAAVMERKYQNVGSAMTAWSLSASALTTYVGDGKEGKGTLRTSFLDMARLVPLWGGGRGVSSLWDPGRDRIYACDSQKSQIWADINEAVVRASSRRIQRLCGAIRRVVDVPVVQEWAGWSGVTEEREPAFDGIAARVAGDASSELVSSAARAVSTAARWSTRGWLVATDVDVPLKDLQVSLDELANLGLRAVYVHAAPSDVAPIAAGRAASPPPDSSIDALFFPENAANPAAVQRLPGGMWWLPTPEDGNRLDFGNQFYGYRMATMKGSRVVLWARTPGRYLLRMLKPDAVEIRTLDGSDSLPKKEKNGVSLLITEVPLIIDGAQEVPIPDLAYKETLAEFGRLQAYSETGRRVGTDQSFAFAQAVESFEANPGGSFFAMREQLRRFAGLLSPVAWIEAESSRENTFSEVAPLPGASGDRALVLRALLPAEEGFVANYSVPVNDRNDVDLWVAAKLDRDRRPELEASVGGQTLFATETPVSAYGAGFAWYRMGRTRLTGGVAAVALRLRSGIGAEAAIDAVVFAPPGWRPSGVAYPYDVIAPKAP